MNQPGDTVTLSRDRMIALLGQLERLAAGDTRASLDISPLHDELDAIAFGVNVLADELRWAHARITEELAHLGRVTMLDALTGSLAHEINQPLTAVMANAEAASRLLAAQPPRIDELRQTLNEIVSDNKRAGDVVRRMKALLRKGVRQQEALDLNGCVVEVVKLVQGNAVSRQISLDIDLAPGLDRVLGDRVQLQQVVLNLLMNAFDAVQDRGEADRRVAVRTSRQGTTATVDVSDRGRGISDEALAKVFEPYVTTKREGMGLGLWICRTIVAAHGGTLTATRNPAVGMTFSANFPMWPASSSDVSKPAASVPAAEPR
jgi:two-component system sensor kinase FixL